MYNKDGINELLDNFGDTYIRDSFEQDFDYLCKKLKSEIKDSELIAVVFVDEYQQTLIKELTKK